MVQPHPGCREVGGKASELLVERLKLLIKDDPKLASDYPLAFSVRSVLPIFDILTSVHFNTITSSRGCDCLHSIDTQRRPSWHSSEQKSSIWVASSTSKSSAITPSGRCSRIMRLKGTWSPSTRDRSSGGVSSRSRERRWPGAFMGFLLMHLVARRQALRYTIRNTSLPQRTRAQAQLQLSQMHCYTRPTQIKNRCIMGGKGRGIMSDFRMSRVSHC